MSKKEILKNAASAAFKAGVDNKWIKELDIVAKRNDILVLLTNAHGGINTDTGIYVTDGKRSPLWDDKTPVHGENIYYEGEGSRDINKKIKEACDYLNIPCIIVNNTWVDTPIHIKRLMVKNLSLDSTKCFGFEIHSNAAPKEVSGKAHGTEFWTLPGQSKSDKFATIKAEENKKEFPDTRVRKDTTDGDADKEANWGILKIEKNYGISYTLDEYFFMDNKRECHNYLMPEEGRIRIARVSVRSIVRFINEYF